MSMLHLEPGSALGADRGSLRGQWPCGVSIGSGWLRFSGPMLAGFFAATLVWAQPQPRPEGSNAEPVAANEPRIEAATDPRIMRRIDALVTETGQLHAEVAAQSELLRRLMSGLDGLLPLSSRQDLDTLSPGQEQLTACRSELAELSARLQQQQLALSEAQRRAEKAEKTTAAMNEARAHAATEIERLSTELATAKARQTEALQQAVDLERRLATAEARLARVTANGQQAQAAANAAANAEGGSEPSGLAIEDAKSRDATTAETPGLAVTPSATGRSSGHASAQSSAPVFYEVRAADTLSRISARVYGDASAWERIYDANRDLLATPEALSPGMSLVIP